MREALPRACRPRHAARSVRIRVLQPSPRRRHSGLGIAARVESESKVNAIHRIVASSAETRSAVHLGWTQVNLGWTRVNLGWTRGQPGVDSGSTRGGLGVNLQHHTVAAAAAAAVVVVLPVLDVV